MQAFKVVQILIARRRGKPKRKSRVEMAWDPERRENLKEPKVYMVFKPPAKPKSWNQDEFSGLDGPQIIKD